MKVYKENGERKVWLTSDLHLCHDREFIWGSRGFKSVDEMNAAIVANWNRVVGPADIVYVLGDFMLNNDERGMFLLKQLKGKIVPVRGNHDNDKRWQNYMTAYNVIPRENDDLAVYLEYDGLTFYLSHFPTICDNFNEGKPLARKIVNLCGHTHTQDRWSDIGKGLIYHVDQDAHNCTPVALDEIIKEIKKRGK